MMLAVSHPNLVSALHIITHERPLALIVEYLAGGSMSDWLSNGTVHPTQDLIFVLHQIACGMAELARRDIGECVGKMRCIF